MVYPRTEMSELLEITNCGIRLKIDYAKYKTLQGYTKQERNETYR